MNRRGAFGFIPAVCGLLSVVCCLSVWAEEPALVGLEQEVRSFSFTGYSKEGKREWEVHGETAVLEGDTATFERPRLESLGETFLTVTSEKGAYDRRTARAHLEENVLARTSDGATLKTESLEWDGATKTIVTDDPVRIEKGMIISRGKGIEAHPDLKTVELKESVTVEMQPDVQITSRGPMELDYANHIAVFKEDVKIVDGEGEVLADRMDVYFDPETDQVREVIATGNVRIKRGNSVSYSDKATYDAVRRKVKLTGKPKLYIESDRDPLSGDPFLRQSEP